MHATDNLAEAERLMTVCNSCRYCEGLCAVFPAMEMRRSFADGDLNYLANLCHACGACYNDCQFAPPHEFDVNVPRVLAQVRNDSYRNYAWPAALRPVFDRNGLWIALATAFGTAGFLGGFVLWHNPAALFAANGDFYDLMPHTVMSRLFIGVTLFALIALVMGFLNFWRDIGAGSMVELDRPSGWQAFRDMATLRYLDGGGEGCVNDGEVGRDRRRFFHHLTFYGFLLCFASTLSATVLHYGFEWAAPYPWYTPPKLLGVPGGIALVVGCSGLWYAKAQRNVALRDLRGTGMEAGFTALLFLTGLSGLFLWFLRGSQASGTLLALHLGAVLALFLTMPYGKFVHSLYRFGALLLSAREMRAGRALGRPVQSGHQTGTKSRGEAPRTI